MGFKKVRQPFQSQFVVVVMSSRHRRSVV